MSRWSSVKHVGGGAYKSFCYRVGEAGIKAHERRVPLAKIEESELQLRVWGAKDLKAVGAHALTYTASPTIGGSLSVELRIVCPWPLGGFHV